MSTLTLLTNNYLKLSAEFAKATNDYKDITEESTKIVMEMATLEKSIMELLPDAFYPISVSGGGYVLRQFGSADVFVHLQPIKNPTTVAKFKLLITYNLNQATSFKTEEEAKEEVVAVNYAVFRNHIHNAKAA